ncbi:CDP-alcohol phosphatidyltransferase family protein [Staphylococcus chromogenes]|nr:CDP-alcohol phosphatidyltransferase family protein [Staphylococcus chromogenes]
MLSTHGRRPAAVVVEPIAQAFLKVGLTPNTVTIAGTLIASAICLVLIPTNHLAWAAILSGLFTAFDMIDGTMARMRGGGTVFGATLDATCDRITDGALFAAITWWLVYTYHAPQLLVAASLVVLVASQVISYVKARAEAGGIKVVGGLIERPERLIIGLVGVGLTGFGVPYAIDVAMWILAVGSLFTIAQRLVIAKRDHLADRHIAAPAGAKEHGEGPLS